MSTAKQNLEDFITCSVCLEMFEGRDPRLLPCGHAFCLMCIQEIHRSSKDIKLKDDEFRCPQCATVSNIPGKLATNYPKFFHATHIHKMLQGSKRKICPSDNNEVTGFCFTCSKAFCDQCLRGHNTNIRYNNHVHVEVTTNSIQSLVCTVHDEMVEAFCTDCCKSVCAHCQVSGHTDHIISDFVISQQRPDTPQQEMIKDKAVKGHMQKLVTMQNEFNAHILDIQDKITKHTEMRIAQITEQRKTLQAELARHQADTNREFEKMRKRYRESSDLIAQAQAQIEQLTQPIPQLPSVSLSIMDKLISDITQKIPTIQADIKNATRCQFTPQRVLLGYLSLHNRKLCLSTRITRDKSDAPSASPSQTQGICWPSVGVATPRPPPAAGSVTPQGPSQPLSGTASPTEPRLITKVHIDTCEPIVDISWTPAGDVLVAAMNDQLVAYNTEGEELPVPSGLSGVECPVWSVAVHQRHSTVALVAGSSVDNYLYVMSLCGGRHAWRVRMIPRGYDRATFTAGGDVLMCGECKLLKYNTKQDIMQCERPTKHLVEYIATTPDNKIIVSGKKQLSVHDQNGWWLSSFPRDTATLGDPAGVCADSRGRVFVADREKRAVLMYTSDGTYVREVVRVDERPVHLALHQDRYLAVGSGEWDLHVYDLTQCEKA